MEILKAGNDLGSFLKKVHNKKITIVSAFVSGTENIVKSILDRNNQLEIIAGTINAFSSPDFFQYCIDQESDNLSLFVDFRYQHSIHWKLYLIEPETVIIGSANFTEIGLSLSRDTCVIIRNKNLFKEYFAEVKKIKENKGVINKSDSSFSEKLSKYKEKHQRTRIEKNRVFQTSSLAKWLEDEENQLISLFFWENHLNEEDKRKAYEIIKDKDESIKEAKSKVRDFFTTSDIEEGKLPYEQGDLVLCIGPYPKSNEVKFYSFDRIIYDREEKTYYMYSYKREDKKYPKPFLFNTQIRKKIKEKAEKWYENDLEFLNRKELQNLIEE